MTSKASAETIGDRIARLRVANGMSQAELARQAGITRSAIAQLESGLSKSPSSENIFRIADALGADPRELTFGPSGKTPTTEHTIAALLQMIPEDPRQEALDFTLYKIEKSVQFIASEKLSSYLSMMRKIKHDMDSKKQ